MLLLDQVLNDQLSRPFTVAPAISKSQGQQIDYEVDQLPTLSKTQVVSFEVCLSI